MLNSIDNEDLTNADQEQFWSSARLKVLKLQKESWRSS